MQSLHSLETHFETFRRNIIGHRQFFDTPYGRKRLLYADWTASGRAYRPIEHRLQEEILPFFGNTHTESTITGRTMSRAYEEARTIIRDHVHADEGDVLLFCGSGMTAAVCRLQRMLGLRWPEQSTLSIHEESRPLVLVTHMEHHSNHITWLETIATVELIGQTEDGEVDLSHLQQLLYQYRHRKTRIAAITACSNVTGIITPYHAIASIMHEHGGLCFVDFASSAPYVAIDMHPDIKDAHLDAIYFSVHKFLGGPGTPGVLVFNSKLYHNRVPDQPGGGTLLYSNPWKERQYLSDIQQREDGGTPPILQGIKAGLCIRLKEAMGVEAMLKRENELMEQLFDRLEAIPGIEILAPNHRQRLGIISFIVTGAHYNLIVQGLNDRYGIQARGGCSCAGTYGHELLKIDKARSHAILQQLNAGNLHSKPGWIRISIHPTMTRSEIGYLADAIETTAARWQQWS